MIDSEKIYTDVTSQSHVVLRHGRLTLEKMKFLVNMEKK